MKTGHAFRTALPAVRVDAALLQLLRDTADISLLNDVAGEVGHTDYLQAEHRVDGVHPVRESQEAAPRKDTREKLRPGRIPDDLPVHIRREWTTPGRDRGSAVNEQEFVNRHTGFPLNRDRNRRKVAVEESCAERHPRTWLYVVSVHQFRP